MRGIVVAMAALALAACGGSSGGEAAPQSTTTGAATSGDESSLEGWAQGLCTSVGEWQATTKSTGAKMANSKDDFAQGAQAVTSAEDSSSPVSKGSALPRLRPRRTRRTQSPRSRPSWKIPGGDIQQALLEVPRTQSEVVTDTARVKALIATMNSDISKTVTKLKSLPDTEGWKAAFAAASCRSAASGCWAVRQALSRRPTGHGATRQEIERNRSLGYK